MPARQRLPQTDGPLLARTCTKSRMGGSLFVALCAEDRVSLGRWPHRVSGRFWSSCDGIVGDRVYVVPEAEKPVGRWLRRDLPAVVREIFQTFSAGHTLRQEISGSPFSLLSPSGMLYVMAMMRTEASPKGHVNPFLCIRQQATSSKERRRVRYSRAALDAHKYRQTHSRRKKMCAS